MKYTRNCIQLGKQLNYETESKVFVLSVLLSQTELKTSQIWFAFVLYLCYNNKMKYKLLNLSIIVIVRFISIVL